MLFSPLFALKSVFFHSLALILATLSLGEGRISFKADRKEKEEKRGREDDGDGLHGGDVIGQLHMHMSKIIVVDQDTRQTDYVENGIKGIVPCAFKDEGVNAQRGHQ